MKLFFRIFLLFISYNLTYAQSSTCQNAAAMCSGNQGPFLNTVGVPSFGQLGCLGSTPNPAWFYMQVGTSGTIDFQLSQIRNDNGAGIDVDFILWGPFNTPINCNSLFGYSPGYIGANNVVACSYSAAPIENFSIPNAVAGQFYMLLVTNFSGAAGTYTLNQTGGSGALSCDIVCGINLGPDQLFCSSTISQYNIVAQFNQAPTIAGTPTYSWYLFNGTSFVLQTNTNVNNLTVNQNGIWKVSVLRPGCVDLAEDEIEIRFDAPPVLNEPDNLLAPVGDCTHTFDLTTVELDLTAPTLPSNYVIHYYLDEEDCAIGNTNYIQNPTAFTVSTTTTIYVRVENIGNAICADANQFFDLVINCIPSSCLLDLTSATATTQQTICINDAIQNITYSFGDDATSVNVTGLPNGLVTNISNGILTISGTPTQTGTFNYQVETVGCTPSITRQGTITISPVPSVTSLTSNTPICLGSDAVFTIQGTAGAVVNYSLNGVPAVPGVTIPTSGQAIVTVTAPTADVTILLSNVVVGTCTTVLTNTTTVQVKPVPSVTALTSNSPICSGENAIFTITGTPNATVNYTLNSGVSIPVLLNNSGIATITITAATTNQQLSLSSIVFDGCSVISTLSETVVVNNLPVVTSLASNNPICLGSDAIFTIQGTAGAVVNYSLNGVLALPGVTIPASGIATVTVTAPTANVTMLLSNVVVGTCSTTLTNITTVDVKPVPVLTSLTSNSPICSGENAVFTITGTPNATVNYTLNGGVSTFVLLDNTGVATITVTAATTNQQLSLSSIVLNGCTTISTLSETVVVNTTPSVTSLASNSPICLGSNAIFTIQGTAGAVVNYSINGVPAVPGVTIPSSGIATVTVTTPTADVTILLSNVVLGTCSALATNTATVEVKPLPEVTALTTNSPICSGTNAVFTVTGTANGTITYSINGATSVTTDLNASGIGTISIPNATANVSISITQISNGTCSKPLTLSQTITILALPSVTSLASNSPICPNETALFTITGTANATVSYSVNGNAATPVTLNATGSYQIQVQNVVNNVTVTLSNINDGVCSAVLTNSQTVIVNPLPSTPTIVAQEDTFCIGEEVKFNVTGGPNDTVSYTVNAGTNQTLLLNASGSGVITVPNPPALIEINLVSVTNGLCSKTISVSDEAAVISCLIPKGISPGNDGNNDFWDLSGYNVKHVEIFNRYGTKVYSKTDYVSEWKGQSDNGNELPDGTYYYVIQFNQKPTETGWVYINREQ